MKRPITPKHKQTDRPKRTTRASVRVIRPSSNAAKTIRPRRSELPL